MAGRKPTVSDEEFLETFAQSDFPVLGSSDLADKFGMTVQGASKRLKNLEESGYLDSRSLGNARAYWITDRGEAFLTNDRDASNHRDRSEN
jgi:predicted transcriptional regulator